MLKSIRLKRVKNIDAFEKTFSSLWKTAKAKGISKKDVVEEIKAYRKGK